MESSLPLGEFKDNSLTMPFILILIDSPKRLIMVISTLWYIVKMVEARSETAK
jgi:hypothetical protein